MGFEIERKFLLKDESWRDEASSSTGIKQGYLNSDKTRTVRVRTSLDKGFITIKGENKGISRTEFEYEIPYEDAVELLKLCEQPYISKIRHVVTTDDAVWEIDEFLGENEGLFVAEVELNSILQTVIKPKWLGKEVSDDAKYYNSSLITNPYKNWD
jgi:adenylate cyclase